MNGNNAAFVANPLAYIQANDVNNLTWWRRAVQPQHGATLGAINNAINLLKEGNFDLYVTAPNVVELRPVGGGQLIADAPIQAYWCPFIQGGGLPGHVDIPKHNPAHRFVFTAAMNGCRFVVTDASPTHFRVYHHQHPDSGGALAAGIWQLIANQGHPILGTFGYDEYGLAPGVAGPAVAPNAFNFLYYRNAIWNFVSQPQTFDMVNLTVTRLPGQATMRSIQ